MMQLKPEHDKQRLANLIVTTGAFEHYDEPKKLSSGKMSHYYFDLKRLTGDPEGINVVAKVLYDHIKQVGGIKSVGGLESGSIAIATAISQLSYNENPGNPIKSFYVRKKAKEYGLQKMIEGCIESPVIVVDDVITTGTSALKAVAEIKTAGHVSKGLLSIVFRGTEDDKKKIESESGFYYLFAEKDFTEKYEKNSSFC